jgi:hypothetical protein
MFLRRLTMKKAIIYLALALSVGLGWLAVASAPVEAQENDTASKAETIDTVLARAAARGFLTTLTRPELSDFMDFYLLDSILVESMRPNLANVADYEIVGGNWLTPGETYEVEARLQPGDQRIILRSGKHNGRWQIDSILLESAPAAAAGSGSAPTGQIVPVFGNGSGQLVFQTRSGADIYVINADGTGLRRVTDGIDPQLSPDGSKIAFTRWEPGFMLYTINVDGTDETAWIGDFVEMKSPTWSADGSRLVFSHRVFFDEGEFVKINPGDAAKAIQRGQEPKIRNIPANARGLKRNEDGTIEFTIPPDAHWSLGQVDLNANEYQGLGTGSRYNYAPSWHPTDPGRLIFRGDKGIGLFDTQAQTTQPVSFDDRDRGALAFSPDGSQIAFSYWQDGHWEIHTINADGTNRQRLTETPLSVIAQNSRSDVIVNEEGFRTLTRAQPDGQENPNWNNAAPVWSPDGSQIAFVTDRSGQWEIWIMNANGSNQRPMFPNGALAGIEFDFAGVDERMLSWRP